MVPNYKINIIQIRKLKDTDMFKTDLKHVLDFIRFSKDKVKLRELVENEPYYQNMEEDAFDVVSNYTDEDIVSETKMNYMEEGGKINMCQALREWMEDERAEGRAEGREEGKVEGIILAAREMNVSDEKIIEILMRRLMVSREQAEEYLK